ncbi:jg14836 [Pararge aegeria aegeria]|uniref:Jg14836 protein n=1 Tax=Pararge aegeria aegeria TaxID=348720 RepID=A0A8S4QTC8_9NEOP|nr:jg14836 [Pararge aegeria aegeria]
MQKLQGLAKIWYEGLNSVLFTWPEWQEKLINAFPCEQNYGQVLEDMLKRKSRYNEPIEVYFYEKFALLNQCDIANKRAVDCIIHGISDRTLRSGALALRSSNPDQLLQFLISSKDSYQLFDRNQVRSKSDRSNFHTQTSQKSNNRSSLLGCYNCREKGHSFLYCPKPQIKCIQCHKVGHTVDKCFYKNNAIVKNDNEQKIMCIDASTQEHKFHSACNSKFIKDVQINGTSRQAFVDFGSEVTLVKESLVKELGVAHDHIPSFLRGFGNGLVKSLGGLFLSISVDGVCARVLCKVVCDNLLERSIRHLRNSPILSFIKMQLSSSFRI